MAINPVDSSSNYISQVQPQPQSADEREAVKDRDNTAQAAAAAAAQSAQAKPTVNTQGQTVGAIINVQA
ncbi:MAG: hypothetical protein PHH36_10280 [Sideroxydans sp.]|nr:hypothetical protein [Sideroxydans sp.]